MKSACQSTMWRMSTGWRTKMYVHQGRHEVSALFFPLNTVHPNAINGAVVRTCFLSSDLEGKPAVWVYEDKPGYFIARTNMSEWVDSQVLCTYDEEGNPIFRNEPITRVIDLASGSQEACLA